MQFIHFVGSELTDLALHSYSAFVEGACGGDAGYCPRVPSDLLSKSHHNHTQAYLGYTRFSRMSTPKKGLGFLICLQGLPTLDELFEARRGPGIVRIRPVILVAIPTKLFLSDVDVFIFDLDGHVEILWVVGLQGSRRFRLPRGR